MKEYIIKEGEGELLIHMTASNENYTISYDRGQLIFQNINKTYIIPKNLGNKIIYDKLDTLTNKNKYQVEDIRTLYRDTTPTDFGLSNKTNVSPGSKHISEEIIVGGINDYIPVVAPEGVKIYVNDNIVGSGTLIYNGDRVKFELVAPASSGTNTNYNLRIGDISKNVSLETALGTPIKVNGVNILAHQDVTFNRLFNTTLFKDTNLSDINYNTNQIYAYRIYGRETSKGVYSDTFANLGLTSGKIYFEYYTTYNGYLFFGDDRNITHSFGSYPYAMLYNRGKAWVLIDLDQKKVTTNFPNNADSTFNNYNFSNISFDNLRLGAAALQGLDGWNTFYFEPSMWQLNK